MLGYRTEQELVASSGNTYLTATLFLIGLRFATAGIYRKNLRLSWSLFSVLSRDAASDSVRHKIHENLWYTLWHSWSFALNLRLLLATDWFWPVVRNLDIDQLFVNLASFRLSEACEWFLDVNLAFWTTCAFFLLVETLRKDFYQMAVHHVFTILLILAANYFRHQRLSLLVLLVHDVVDIFLYFAKCALYKNFRSIADVSFVVFAILFLCSRLIAYPLYCILPWWRSTLSTGPPAVRIIPAMLSGLYVLHLIWWQMIVKMVRAWLDPKQTVDKDCRSDDEDEDEDKKKKGN